MFCFTLNCAFAGTQRVYTNSESKPIEVTATELKQLKRQFKRFRRKMLRDIEREINKASRLSSTEKETYLEQKLEKRIKKIEQKSKSLKYNEVELGSQVIYEDAVGQFLDAIDSLGGYLSALETSRDWLLNMSIDEHFDGYTVIPQSKKERRGELLQRIGGATMAVGAVVAVGSLVVFGLTPVIIALVSQTPTMLVYCLAPGILLGSGFMLTGVIVQTLGMPINEAGSSLSPQAAIFLLLLLSPFS